MTPPFARSPAPPLPLLPPLPLDTRPSPAHVPRDTVVTQTVVSSQSATSAATTKASSAFPVAVAVPALVGGMAVALLAFGLYLWMARRRRREKRRRWESAQRRARKRAASNATRPSMSSSRRPSVSNDRKPVISEKEQGAIPPVPVLPKAHDPYAKTEKDHGYQPSMQQQAYDYHSAQDTQAYAPQPTIEQQQYDNYGADQSQAQAAPLHDAYAQDYSAQAQAQLGSQAAYDTQPAQSPAKSRKKSRTAARVAAAEEAAAAARSDPLKRHQTKKPSAFARQAQQADHTGYYDNEEQQETLAPAHEQRVSYGASDDGRTRTSGQWGVSGGSAQVYGQGHGQGAGSGGSGHQRYSNDPYLSAQAEARTPSGQYGTDPYALYHDEREKSGEWSGVVNSMGGAKKGNWV